MKTYTDVFALSALHGLLLWIRPLEAKITVGQEMFLTAILLIFAILLSRKAWKKVEDLTTYNQNILIVVAGFLIGIFLSHIAANTYMNCPVARCFYLRISRELAVLIR